MYSPSFLTIFLAFTRTFLYLLVPMKCHPIIMWIQPTTGSSCIDPLQTSLIILKFSTIWFIIHCNGYSSSCTWTPLSWYRSILFTCLDMMTLSLNGSKSMLTPYYPYLMIPIEWPSMITTRCNSSLRINTLFYASNNSYAPTPFLSSLGILFHPPKSWLRRPFYVNSRMRYGSWNDLQAIFSQSHSQFHYVVGCSYQSQAQF